MSDHQQQMSIFTRTYDLLVWLLQVTRHFPKMHRHDFTKRPIRIRVGLRCANPTYDFVGVVLLQVTRLFPTMNRCDFTQHSNCVGRVSAA